MNAASRLIELLLPNLVLSSDGEGEGVDLSSAAKCCISKFSLLGDQDLFDRLMLIFLPSVSTKPEMDEIIRVEVSNLVGSETTPNIFTPYQKYDKE